MSGFPSKAKGNQRAETAKRPHPGVPLDKNTLMKLIELHTGNVSRVADAIGSDRYSVKRRIDSDVELSKALENARERKIDKLEQCVWERAMEGKDTALQLFLLKTQARHRGYDQDEVKNAARDIATAAFDFIVNKTKNPAEPNKPLK